MSDVQIQGSFHGVAARLDRLPSGKFQRKAMWLIGGICFCDCLDMNVGGPIIAQLLASGWSDNNLNAMFVSMTAFGYLVGGLLAGMISDYFGRVRACVVNTLIFFYWLRRRNVRAKYLCSYSLALHNGHWTWRCLPCRVFCSNGVHTTR